MSNPADRPNSDLHVQTVDATKGAGFGKALGAGILAIIGANTMSANAKRMQRQAKWSAHLHGTRPKQLTRSLLRMRSRTSLALALTLNNQTRNLQNDED
jgi:hypothetical protein